MIGNTTPISLKELLEQGIPIEDVMRWFDEKFGGYVEYRKACIEDPAKVDRVLKEENQC